MCMGSKTEPNQRNDERIDMRAVCDVSTTYTRGGERGSRELGDAARRLDGEGALGISVRFFAL
jgi:hypothetical protein